MKRSLAVLGSFAAITVTIWLAASLEAQPRTRPPRKIALLVGPSTYLHDFDKLKYCDQDVTALAEELRLGGFDAVVVLTDPPEGQNPATKKNIEAKLKALMDGNGIEANTVRKGDVVMVVLSGHGIEKPVQDPNNPKEYHRDVFFVPVNGKKDAPETLINLNEMIDRTLSPSGGTCFLLVDACREIYEPNKGKGIGIDDVKLKGKTAVMLSCSTDEKSWESVDASVKHGVFSYAILETMRKARTDREPLLWTELVASVQKKMLSDDFKKYIPDGEKQNPVSASGQLPATMVLAVHRDDNEPKPGEVREFEIAAGVKMKFCWIPPGEAQLGSPKEEQDYITKQFFDGKRPDFLDTEDESKRGKYKSKGFWMAKYPVTQAEWNAVGVKKEKECGFQGDRLPVETVSWDESVAFVDALDRRGGTATTFGKRGKLTLPHEDEWEYACRGGLGNKQAFYFGNVLNGDKANCDGNYPYGTTVKGEYKKKTTAVGSYEAVARHPWGLCDMHGNVLQWCENSHSSEQIARVLRGGSWLINPRYCRCASRFRLAASNRLNDFGFRVVFRLD